MRDSLSGNTPDFVVLTKQEFCAAANISEDTLNRLHAQGRGPVRVQLSPRRIGYTVGAIRTWLQSRTESQAA
jgi:predicted DNA-binding transcriptional regulator AlpA